MPKKTTSAKKKPAKKTVKKTAKKSPAKKVANQSSQKTAKKATKKALKKTSGKSPAKKKAAPKSKAPVTAKVSGKAPKRKVADSKHTPIVFSLDDVEELMASKKKESQESQKSEQTTPTKKTAPQPQPKKTVIADEPVEQRTLGAASLADILGFNPAEKKKSTDLSDEEIPKKWKKYYNLLIELRHHVRDELDLHTADTLKHSSRDDSGDLSGYGSHQADAGTDTFDRDFALSLVSNEHEALNEIEEAIQRIRNGTYGICEVTGKPIPAARLTAVPFARFSVDGQAEYEKNMRRKVNRGANTGLFGDASDAPKMAANDDDE